MGAVSAYELFAGDCLDPATGMASLGDGSVDSIVTDPPYAEQTHAGARSAKDVNAASIDFAATTPEMLRAVLEQCGRISRRWVIATVDWRHVLDLEANPPKGLRFVRFGVWVKPNGAPQFTGDRPATGWEAVAIMHSTQPGKMRWNGGGNRAVWTVNIEQGCVHPTQKPLLLIESFVRDFTDPGDLICDPFAGSGTTGVAAIRLGRRFVGWEKDEKYHAAAMRRLAGTTEQRELFGAPRAAKAQQFSLLPDKKPAAAE